MTPVDVLPAFAFPLLLAEKGELIRLVFANALDVLHLELAVVLPVEDVVARLLLDEAIQDLLVLLIQLLLIKLALQVLVSAHACLGAPQRVPLLHLRLASTSCVVILFNTLLMIVV